jgi:ribose 5-phosphate isomerase B
MRRSTSALAGSTQTMTIRISSSRWARAVVAGSVERGIAVCGSGVGASICANKVPGVRAALILDNFSARQGVEDDHMNVTCLGGRVIGPMAAWDILQAFLAADFSLGERHLRRQGRCARNENDLRATSDISRT